MFFNVLKHFKCEVFFLRLKIFILSKIFGEVIMKIWSDKEVVSLFGMVEKCRKNSTSLRFAFEDHAKNFSRKANSVRNYYYQEVDNLQKDVDRCKRLNIDLTKHQKFQFVRFDAEAEKKLLGQIGQLTAKGMSVRAACEKLSGGDLVVMTRIQNKYQSLKRRSVKADNVVVFRKQTLLGEEEINSLFLGLVKLVKKSATEEVEAKIKEEKLGANLAIKKAAKAISEKEQQILILKSEVEKLKEENYFLSEQLSKRRSRQQQLKDHFVQNSQQNNFKNKKEFDL